MYPRIADKIRLKKGTLVYKFVISYSPKTVRNVITNILDELLQAEKKLELENVNKEGKVVRLNLPQFDGHFEKEYTINLKGVSNEKEAGIFTRV